MKAQHRTRFADHPCPYCGNLYRSAVLSVMLAEEPMQTFQAVTAEMERMAAWLSSPFQWSKHTCNGYLCTSSWNTIVYRLFWPTLGGRAVLGNKTDVNDVQWSQRSRVCGLLRTSFHPELEIATR